MGRPSAVAGLATGRTRRDVEGRLAERRERRVGASSARHQSVRRWDRASGVGCGVEVGQPKSQSALESRTSVCAPTSTRHGLDALRLPEARRSRGRNGRHPLRDLKSASPLVAQGAIGGALTTVVGQFATDNTGRPADHRATRGWSAGRHTDSVPCCPCCPWLIGPKLTHYPDDGCLDWVAICADGPTTPSSSRGCRPMRRCARGRLPTAPHVDRTEGPRALPRRPALRGLPTVCATRCGDLERGQRHEQSATLQGSATREPGARGSQRSRTAVSDRVG
jgi:hypothetical protein